MHMHECSCISVYLFMQVDTESSVSIERSAGSKVRGDRIRVLDDAIAYQMNIVLFFAIQ